MTQVSAMTDWVLLEGIKAKVKAGEALTEEDVEFLQRLVDWLDAKSLEEEGFPEEWT
jgi:hypothetical protein